MTIQFVIGVFAISLTLFSCNKKNEAKKDSIIEKSQERSELSDTKWKLISINKNVIDAEKFVTLNFGSLKGNSISYSGKSFVNSYGGEFSVDRTKLKESKTGHISQMLSVNERDTELEKKYIDIVTQIASFEIKSSNLLLSTTSGDVLEFAKQ
jgi:heat shock protein HslJ